MCSVMGKFLSSFAHSGGISKVGNSSFITLLYGLHYAASGMCVSVISATSCPIWATSLVLLFIADFKGVALNFSTNWV